MCVVPTRFLLKYTTTRSGRSCVLPASTRSQARRVYRTVEMYGWNARTKSVYPVTFVDKHIFRFNNAFEYDLNASRYYDRLKTLELRHLRIFIICTYNYPVCYTLRNYYYGFPAPPIVSCFWSQFELFSLFLNWFV